ncbi:MAG TPA: plasmid stabilization protein, partial [Bacteroidia bacterium]|nr:plasmid stabilization protein [Bacteroidia bacterium]
KVKHVREAVRKFILRLEAANSLSEIPSLKKLTGHKTAYRVRIGDHRLGFFYEGNVVLLARILDRKEIYKVFP